MIQQNISLPNNNININDTETLNQPFNYARISKSYKTSSKILNMNSVSPNDKIKHQQRTPEGMLGDHIVK